MSNPFSQSTLLSVGATAPDFTLLNQEGQPVQLYDILKKGWVVLFFYPKDHSPMCTSQVCAFRNAYEDFQFSGAEVIGISADTVESHQDFSERQSLSFPLLSDPKRAVAKQFGVPMVLGVIPSRVTFVIDPEHTVRLSYSSQFSAKAHMDKALEVLQQHCPPAR